MKLVRSLFLALSVSVPHLSTVDAGGLPDVQIHEITHTVVQMGLQDGVTADAAANAMMAKAREFNLKFVSRHKMHDEIRAAGNQSPHLEVFQFCNADDAIALVSRAPVYSAYMPAVPNFDGRGPARQVLAGDVES